MQISDIARQYVGTTSSSEAMTGTRGVENLVSSIRDLTAGNIFEGTINSIQDGKVVIGLSNGTLINARLDASMQLMQGQSMFFQVKSNNGEMIAIRPYTVDGNGVNLTLLNALNAAGLPVTDKFLNLANNMMQEHMPIDKNMLSQMARILMANPDMSVNTLVQMKKLNIPITNEMVAQFENYVDDSSAVHKALDSFIAELPTMMEGKEMSLEQLRVFDSQLLDIIADGMEKQPQTTETMQQVTETMQQTGVSQAIKEEVLNLIKNTFGETEITAEDSPAEMLSKLSRFILSGETVSKDALQALFSSKDMQQFLRDTLETQMYLTPEEVADADKVKKLYERLEFKSQRIESLLNQAGLKETPLAQTVTEVRGNVEFMNQLNQAYTYVQIPLKMAGQNASGQLYVYTNKRDMNDPDKELSAFLHLDLDNLGSTDISVKMLHKKVDTKFYMETDEAFELIKAHMSELEERLRKKGFDAKVYVENEGKKVNFLDDFLKKDAPPTGQVHRYSFDVRA